MKIINSDFDQIEQYEGTKFEEGHNKVLTYLRNVIKDEKVLSDIEKVCSNILIQKTDGKTYGIKDPSGEIKPMKYRNATAFKTPMEIKQEGNSLNVIPGIALRPTFNENEDRHYHTYIHELLHALSSIQDYQFDENGITITKTGTKIDYINKKFDSVPVEENLSADGLNEGVTEALATFIDGKPDYSVYPLQTPIAELLLTSNSLLLNAYFSHDLSRLEAFYTDLEEKQNIITREDIYSLSANKLSIEQVSKLVIGAISYNRAYNPDCSQEYYDMIIRKLDIGYPLDNNMLWSNVIASYQTGMGSMN